MVVVVVVLMIVSVTVSVMVVVVTGVTSVVRISTRHMLKMLTGELRTTLYWSM